jgi:hypothetical protein
MEEEIIMIIWIGREQEGSLKGIYTMFIGSPLVTFEEITELLKKYVVEQIYFGAGRCTKINYDVVKRISRGLPKMLLTLEVDYMELPSVPKSLFKNKNLCLIVTITNKRFSKFNHIPNGQVQIKIQALENDRYLSVGHLSNFSKTNLGKLEGKKYLDDVVIK